MVYQWREGSRWSGKAQDVGETLERIRVAHGGTLTPEAVLSNAVAQPALYQSLYKQFEWDDAKAARAHRIETARSLIRDVMVVYAEEVQGAPREPMRAFTSLSAAGMAYTSTLEAVQSPQLRAIVLLNAKKELEGWRRRYRHYQELARAVELADEAAKAIPEPVAA